MREGGLFGRACSRAYSDYTPTVTPVEWPTHLQGVAEEHHDAVCRQCNQWITIGSSGKEYGHHRGVNNGGRSCPHRPRDGVDPRNSWAKRGGQEGSA